MLGHNLYCDMWTLCLIIIFNSEDLLYIQERLTISIVNLYIIDCMHAMPHKLFVMIDM